MSGSGTSADDGGMAAPDVQEALGVTPEGNCQRHPNCPVLSLVHNKVMSCRVCFSEEKSVGIRQRKSFAAVVQQLQQKSDDDVSVASTDNNDEADVEEHRRRTRRAKAASMQALILQQPQTLDSIMKRTTQVQNWLLRQKEKEVMSLQLRIQTLEQSLHDAEAQNQEQRQTIWALRRTIQQDMKIIKTMTVQKERERENMSQHESPMNSSTTSSPSKRSGQLSQADSPSLISPGKSKNRNTLANSASAHSTPMTSPAGKVFFSSGPNTPDPDTYSVGNDDATPEAMKGIVLGNNDPLLDKVRQKKKALQSKFEELRAANSASGGKPAQNKSMSAHALGRGSTNAPSAGGLRRTDGNSLRTHSARSLEEMVEPPQLSGVGSAAVAEAAANNQKEIVVEPQEMRKQYWNDDEYADMTSDPSKIFASFRGGLLDIPKSPPAASHDNRIKNRPKLHLEADQMAQLKMPRMRGIGRTLSYQSDDISADGLSIGSESASQRDNPFNLASPFGGLPLSNPMGDEAPEQMFEDDNSITSAISADSFQPPPPPLHASGATTQSIPPATRKAKRTVSTDEILDVVLEGHNEDEELGASKSNFNFAPPMSSDDEQEKKQEQEKKLEQEAKKREEQRQLEIQKEREEEKRRKEEEERRKEEENKRRELQRQKEEEEAQRQKEEKQAAAAAAAKKPPPVPKPATGQQGSTQSKNTLPGDDETIDTTPSFFTESGALIALSGEAQKKEEAEQFLFPVTGAESQDKYGDPGMYTGTILVTEGMPQGKGCMNYDSGRVYNGDWVSGQWHGHGKLLNPNGDTYEGEFVLDARHGKGEYRWDNGDVYTGDFTYDRRSGNGKFCFHNGNVYEGEFVDGMFEGFGRYEFKGGYYEGEWRQGRYHGDGELLYANGGKYTGEFRESLAHGFGVEVLPDGQKRRGVWERGQPVEFFNTRPSGAQSVGSSSG
eukprot:CAMPEP_0172450064 /NCGR_PEP_ID=MMETSP1065-20121228/8576_1 /TAXON_ID=265537 /ORGANISM="Amphiprora paludosa, Strain CCMP125" /LENGTH=947 /DNA_ID=CAMNT_0013201833 /DNA_START=61 /DNA_END=2904 /DNA_ORIENTATION=+